MTRFLSYLSMGTSTAALYLVGYGYIKESALSSLPDFAATGISFFGVTAALAGLCFSMIPVVTSEDLIRDLRFAGEKFFHSSLLFVQVLAFVLLRTSLEEASWADKLPAIVELGRFLIQFVAITLGVAGLLSWLWAFEHLNDHFWVNWVNRVSSREQSPKAIARKARRASKKPHKD